MQTFWSNFQAIFAPSPGKTDRIESGQAKTMKKDTIPAVEPVPERLGGVAEAAAVGGCSPATIWLKAREGKIRRYKRGRLTLFDLDEVERLQQVRPA